ncbi:glycosyltransferase family 2 protein [Snuella sedimenti]|uniref:Glycosyltransferase family 2 protein n=1 Tax=Snuella sedimenti TaxID=2798802 RepID=A0A8J7IND1_9FLAO|nr:glycosyltransferase family 2 protein [Snuella sedimenti]MBJ6367902.1 glycosyltransferase family 2 protein [Snuella sedimenti]
MGKDFLVSVIIPTYNRAHLLGETLQSVLNQSYEFWECIIVDDGSTDNTREEVLKFCNLDNRFSYYVRPDSYLKGANTCRKYGFELSKGLYINWLDSDDVLINDKLEKQIRVLEKQDKSVCVSNAEFFDQIPNDCPENLWSDKLIVDNVKDALVLQKVRWATGALLWKRDVVHINNWKEGLQGGQEWLFNILSAFYLQESDFCFLDETVLFVRNSNESITRDASLVFRFNNYLLARILLLEHLFDVRKPEFYKYFNRTYLFSLKYIKLLASKGRFKFIFRLSRLIYKYSKPFFLKFWFGLFFYAIFKKDYFLKGI